MENKRKHLPGWVTEISIAVLLVLLCLIFVDVSIEGILEDKGGSCIAVVFDKPLVRGADRVVVYEYGQTITITDRDAVRQIAGLFTVANCTDLCNPGRERRIEIYNGNRLVREIRATLCGFDTYYIYDCDLFHWAIPSGCGSGEVYLDRQQQDRLDEIIEQYA